jgi:hypothetical protein
MNLMLGRSTRRAVIGGIIASLAMAASGQGYRPGYRVGLRLAANAQAARALTNNAVRLFGPGHGTGVGTAAGTGAAVAQALAFINESKAPITVVSLMTSGRFLTSTGWAAIGNNVPYTANIEYPSGTVVATITQAGGGTPTVISGQEVETDRVATSVPIPVGASFVVRAIIGALPSTQKYPTTSGGSVNILGLIGVMSTTAPETPIAKVNLLGIGDSIATNNGAVFYTAAAGRCPCLQMSIGGTAASSYATSSVFAWHTSIMQMIGCTTLVGDFSTNDIGNGRSLSQIQTDLMFFKTSAAAVGVKTYWTTLTPRTGDITVTAGAGALDGNSQPVLTVPDASRFVVNHLYVVAGSSTVGINGTRAVSAVDTTANTVTFVSSTAVAAPAGTITITAPGATGEAGFMVPVDPKFAAGPSSMRGQYNAWIRAGAFDGYIDWADSCEPFRDAGRWAIGGESPYLTAQRLVVVVGQPINSARFNFAAPSIPNNSFAGGQLQWITGGNRGSGGSGNGSGTSDITLQSAPAVGVAANDTAVAIFNTSRASDDGLHPRVSVSGAGGQQLIQAPTNVWLTALAA